MAKRSNGEGCIVKTANGKWSARIQIGFKPNGKPKIKTFSGDTRKEATEKLNAYRCELERIDNMFQGASKLNVSMKYWMETYKRIYLKPSSYDRLEVTITSNILPYIGNEKILDTAKKLCYKLAALSDICTEGLFIDWKDIIQNQKAVIIQLSDFNESIRTLYTKIILSDLWNWIKKNDNRQELLLVLDEFKTYHLRDMPLWRSSVSSENLVLEQLCPLNFLGKPLMTRQSLFCIKQG